MKGAGKPAVIALLSSADESGGVERYADGGLAALSDQGVHVDVIVPTGSTHAGVSVRGKVEFLREALRACRSLLAAGHRVTVFCFNYRLAYSLAAVRPILGGVNVVVFLFGPESWGHPVRVRMLARLIRPTLVTISSFTAGSVVRIGNVRVVPPVLRPEWSWRLLRLDRPAPADGTPLRILSTFRLEAAEDKGASELVRAVELARGSGSAIELTVAGRGPAPEMLRRRESEWLSVVESPDDEELAGLYGSHDLFVLASRTHGRGRHPAGEGFGIVLLEAQLSGLPVVAPAHGGSHEAVLAGLTGLRPRDETPGALADLLVWCCANRADVRQLGEWSRRLVRGRHDAGVAGREWLALVDPEVPPAVPGTGSCPDPRSP